MMLQKETKTVSIRNRQHLCTVDVSLLRKITRCLLKEYFAVNEFELGIHLVEAAEMTEVNEHFLRHAGSTDVITFDYGELPESQASSHIPSSALRAPSPRRTGGRKASRVSGEMYICVTEAQIQARCYRVDLASEILRYVIHGMLHLRGYDDKTAKLRRPMKREEDRLLAEISRRFSLKQLVRV
jgi:probable rRNA maturation factor